MRILALDLGKRKSVACIYQGSGDHGNYRTVATDPALLHDLFVELEPDRVVFEICPVAGWLADLVRALDIELQVVNVAHDAWRWRNVRSKSDRLDALKLAQLSAMDQLSLVHVPERGVRQWRSLIAYRKRLVGRRKQVQNTIRAILDREALTMPTGQRGWSAESLERLREHARPLATLTVDELWRGQLWLELQALEAVKAMLAELEAKLNVACPGKLDPV
jgi:transposase